MEIKNKEDFIDADNNLGLIKLSSDEISIIDVDDIWDGPLSGTCRWRNKTYFFILSIN